MGKNKKRYFDKQNQFGNENIGVPDDSPPMDEEIKVEELEEKPKEEEPTIKKEIPEVKYREVVYLGVSEEAERIGVVTGIHYIFRKDRYGMTQPTNVDERDYPAIVAEKGRGCARRSPEIMFMSKIEWELELEQARQANR